MQIELTIKESFGDALALAEFAEKLKVLFSDFVSPRAPAREAPAPVDRVAQPDQPVPASEPAQTEEFTERRRRGRPSNAEKAAAATQAAKPVDAPSPAEPAAPAPAKAVEPVSATEPVAAPAPATAAEPAPVEPPASVALDDVKRIFGQCLVFRDPDPEPMLAKVLQEHGLKNLRSAEPQQFASLFAGFSRVHAHLVATAPATA